MRGAFGEILSSTTAAVAVRFGERGRVKLCDGIRIKLVNYLKIKQESIIDNENHLLLTIQKFPVG